MWNILFVSLEIASHMSLDDSSVFADLWRRLQPLYDNYKCYGISVEESPFRQLFFSKLKSDYGIEHVSAAHLNPEPFRLVFIPSRSVAKFKQEWESYDGVCAR